MATRPTATAATATETTTSQVGTTPSLFERLFSENEKTLKGQNKMFLQQNLKMKFINASNNAKQSMLTLEQNLNNQRSRLDNLDLNEIISLRSQIESLENVITAAATEYSILFGETLPSQI